MSGDMWSVPDPKIFGSLLTIFEPLGFGGPSPMAMYQYLEVLQIFVNFSRPVTHWKVALFMENIGNCELRVHIMYVKLRNS